MKIPVYSLKGEVKKNVDIARVFSETVREDLIRRAVSAEQAAKRQPYGVDPLAGKRTSAHYHGRRGIRHSMMNREMARMKRIHHPGFLYMTARFVPQAVKGRKAHPPKAEKIWKKKINKKERLKALFSALSATIKKDLVLSRGHKIKSIKHLPLVLEDKFQEIKRVKKVREVLEKFGFSEELERIKEKKVRAGKGKNRGRKHKKKRGPLIIISEDKGIFRAARNIPGIEVTEVENLTVEKLAPGSKPGRLCIWTESALTKLENIGE